MGATYHMMGSNKQKTIQAIEVVGSVRAVGFVDL